MPVLIKHNVRFHSDAQAMAVAHVTVTDVFREVGCKCRLTGGIEEHEPPSRHVYGGAFDYGIRDISEPDQYLITRLIQERLGPAFDVVLESNHIHVEYDPKD
jgi:hypothetical protein